MYTIYICMNNPYSYNYSFRINIKVNNSTFEFEIINNIRYSLCNKYFTIIHRFVTHIQYQSLLSRR